MTRRTAWFAAFVHPTPARLEDWLELQASRGWEPRELDDMSAIRMHLQQAKPAKVRYVVDPQQKIDGNYRATYEDAGWKYVGELSSLQVWRRRYTGARPEAFTDRPSRRARDVRMAWATGTLGTLALLGALTRVILGVAAIGKSAEDWPLEAGILALIGIPLVAVTVALVRRRAPSAADGD
ncbi:DUF2812 domain-containing protein [Demequina lutea]|uniref:DUF2812 domain-containing protein n=1 Tax=Demequina lutea TaxID=431489 RepID=A0A7Z0CI95_9MICO|nr:DUF2812 domain-containing protein [Demequina lutea]NYI41669.1 hypothetical protein [Demequina lutea]